MVTLNLNLSVLFVSSSLSVTHSQKYTEGRQYKLSIVANFQQFISSLLLLRGLYGFLCFVLMQINYRIKLCVSFVYVLKEHEASFGFIQSLCYKCVCVCILAAALFYLLVYTSAQCGGA